MAPARGGGELFAIRGQHLGGRRINRDARTKIGRQQQLVAQEAWRKNRRCANEVFARGVAVEFSKNERQAPEVWAGGGTRFGSAKPKKFYTLEQYMSIKVNVVVPKDKAGLELGPGSTCWTLMTAQQELRPLSLHLLALGKMDGYSVRHVGRHPHLVAD